MIDKLWVLSFRESARTDMLALYDYILDASGSYVVASHYVQRLLARCDQLQHFPELGPARPDLGPDIRTLVFERRTLVVYALRPRKIIDVIAILHGGRATLPSGTTDL